MRELPENWTEVPLLEVSDLVRGVTYSKGDAQLEPFNGSIPVLRANNIQDRGFRLTDLVHVPESLVAEKQHVGSGDVVVATSSGSISVVGKAAQALADMNVGFGAFCGLLRPGKAVHAPYFGFFFSSDDYRKAVSSMARGVNINNLKREHFESLKLPLAPLAEQKRIADKLEAVLGRVDACRARLDRVPALLKRFRQSVLAAATSGKLTEEWREGSTTEAWRLLKVCDVGSVQLGRQRAPKYHRGENMRPYLRVQNVFEARIDLSDVMEMEFSEVDFNRYRLSFGDILLNEGQSPQYLGRPAMYRDDLPGACFTNSLIRFRANQEILDREFALLVFRHYMHSGRFTKEGSITTNIAHLSAGKFANIEFSLPPLSEQQEIVRRVEALFAFADRIEARLATARKTVERLTPATLAKAFRGELVPQDPNDEPASALLERLHAQSEPAAAKPKRGRRAKSTSA